MKAGKPEADTLLKKRKNPKEMSNRFREGLGFNSKEMTMKSEQTKTSKNFSQITKKTLVPSETIQKKLKTDEDKNLSNQTKRQISDTNKNLQESIDDSINQNKIFVLDDKNGKSNLIKSKKYLDPRKEYLATLKKSKKKKSK